MLLVVADPVSGSSVDRAMVSVTPGTTVWTPQGRPAGLSDLAQGELVAVWFDGPVAETYPVQAQAGAIRIVLSD